MRDLFERSKRIRDAAGRAYQAAKVAIRQREVRRETDEEIRQAIRESIGIGEHDLGSVAFD